MQLDYGIVSVIVVAAWIAVLGAFRTRDARIVGVGVSEYKRVVNASAITFGALAVGFLLLKVDIARGYVVLAFPLGVVALLVSRWTWRQWLIRRRDQGAHLSRVVVVGARADVEDVAAQILLRPASGYAVVGVAIDDHLDGLEVAGRTIPVVSDLGSVAAAAARTAADAVIVASQPRAGSNAVRTLAGSSRARRSSWCSRRASPTSPARGSTSARSRASLSSTWRSRSSRAAST
ncbi:hypothetical protein BC477_17245 [Clavibacter michiganensis subsp. michiganensis]|uniref:Polyprenyl glycosylphosphotransferase n=1 Tax=Clavibacter michiganensis subsp. michiganensis TaxID=33013 RepID=A0A251XDQ8_CLAMM|nr:hypothetical protein BC477_17245 [Clavibacter michiganensis subsp. michiganensis]OUE00347.1 hypothetical protein CMMCAS07_18255 [Clavibacter michiganensis subsp. michiganensis]